jgi:glycerophosphoryl diester phosphodiesterase
VRLAAACALCVAVTLVPSDHGSAHVRAAAPDSTSTSLTLRSVAQSRVSPACPRSRVRLIAHRGTGVGTRTIGGHRYSENTISAFGKAMRSGVEGFETDYWPTSDGRLVSHHDPTLDRMTDGSGRIREHGWRYVRLVHNGSGAGVPTLRGVEGALARYGGMRQQEIKNGQQFSNAKLSALVRIDRTYVPDADRRVLVTSSELPTLRRVHLLAPTIGIGLITRSRTGRPTLAALPRWVDVIAIDLRAADGSYVRRARSAGYRVSVRGVNTVAQLHRAVAVGATRVVTDRPEVLGTAC